MKALGKLLQSDPGESDRQFRDAFWSAWLDEHRLAVAKGFWELGESGQVEEMIDSLARWLRFRPISVRRAASLRKAEWLLRLMRVPDQVGSALIVASEYVFKGCQPLCEGFFEQLGVPHESGAPASMDYPLPAPEAIRRAIEWWRHAHQEWQLELLLAVVASVEPRWRPLLSDVLGQPVATLDKGDVVVSAPAVALAAAAEAPGAAETPAATREPEDNERFTTLDNLVIKAVVASLNNIEGALHLDAIEDLVDEVVELNADRQRSFFHRGFLDVLRHRELRPAFPGDNASRRCWYLAGVLMGLTRQGRLDEVAGLYGARSEAVRELLSRPRDGGLMVAPYVFRALRGAGRRGEALAAVDLVLPSLGTPFVHDLLSDASDLLRRGQITDARQILDAFQRQREEVLAGLRVVDEDYAGYFEERLDRKRAQCLQFQGELDHARAVLDKMLEGPRPRELASILADRGLIEGGFRSLREVRLPDAAEAEEQIGGALERGEAFFRRALDEEPDYATNAAYCLGVLAMLRRNEREAVPRLAHALTGMARAEESYRVGGILPRTEFLLALALLESGDPGRVLHATELTLRALRAGVDVPLRWWTRSVMAASMYGDALVAELGEELCMTVGDAVIDAVGNVPEALRATAVREALRRRAGQQAERLAQRWEDWERLLRYHLGRGDRAEAADALDALEELSLQSPERERFLGLLDDPGRYEPAWDREDAIWARVRLLESRGRYEQAAALLTDVFHGLLVDPTEQALEEAHSLVERVRGYGLHEYDLSQLEARLDALSRIELVGRVADDESDLLARGPVLRVLVVGGNETQARYDAALRAELAAEHPRVLVEIVHTSMSSNWGRQLDDMRGRVVGADAVVIMRMIRTQLGRALREMTPIWVPCVGRGKDSLKRAIVRAATVAARRGQR